MKASRVPRVSIGLPVYNGERFLEASLNSILSQTYDDFEIIISDNASTDRTPEICREYASRDSRIRYSQNKRNLGAAPNFNLTFKLSSGEFFKWAAHDDLIAPEFLEKCLDSLESEPDAVSCQSFTEFIDAEDNSIGEYKNRLTGSDSSRPSERFAAAVLLPHACSEFHGLIRKTALVGTLLLGDFHGSDRALIAELCLKGRLLQIPEPLFMIRDHAQRYKRSVIKPKDMLTFHNIALANRRHFPTWRLYGEYWRMIGRNVKQRKERFLCYSQLLKWWTANWNWARMGVDILAQIHPEILGTAQRLKQRHFDPEPGPTKVNISDRSDGD
jgi:glycosyltransferase involved in cell wall biosynthesis